jgi:hypothetical protein
MVMLGLGLGTRALDFFTLRIMFLLGSCFSLGGCCLRGERYSTYELDFNVSIVGLQSRTDQIYEVSFFLPFQKPVFCLFMLECTVVAPSRVFGRPPSATKRLIGQWLQGGLLL